MMIQISIMSYLNHFDDKAEGNGEGGEDDDTDMDGDTFLISIISHLNHFDDKAEGNGEGGEDDEQGDEGDEVRAQAGTLLAACWKVQGDFFDWSCPEKYGTGPTQQ